jgi:putative nucleotidyltransferase with HDIG domain
MNITSRLPELVKWFDDYVCGFSSDDPDVMENVALKRDHTLGVCEAARDIGESLGLSHEDLCLAGAGALLHDIGRFEQYHRYRTFSDSRSENHGALGVKVINETGILEGLNGDAAKIILFCVAAHNRADLPEISDRRALFFLKLLRDADKVDIWRVVTGYYENADNHTNRAVALNLPDDPEISDAVCRSLMEGRVVNMADLKTVNDFKLLQMGWVYDLNFPRTFELAKQNRYIEKIRDALPRTEKSVEKIYERVSVFLEEHLKTRY